MFYKFRCLVSLSIAATMISNPSLSNADTVSIGSGWTLVGNGVNQAFDLTTLTGNLDIFKWQSDGTVSGRWAGYRPGVSDATLAKGLALSGLDSIPSKSIGVGEGFWINNRSFSTFDLPIANPVKASEIKGTLKPGWNLVSIGETIAVSDFVAAINDPQGLSVTSVFQWDSGGVSWTAYIPDLGALGTTNALGLGAISSIKKYSGAWISTHRIDPTARPIEFPPSPGGSIKLPVEKLTFTEIPGSYSEQKSYTQITASGEYADGTLTRVVQPIWTSDNGVVTFINNLMVIGAVSADQVVGLTAKYTENGIMVSQTTPITILNTIADSAATTTTTTTTSTTSTTTSTTVGTVTTTTQRQLALSKGWNLIGNGLNERPIVVATTFGNTSNVTTIWKWIANSNRWAFFSPVLIGQQLIDYAYGKGYDVLTTIEAGDGFWINVNQDFVYP